MDILRHVHNGTPNNAVIHYKWKWDLRLKLARRRTMKLYVPFSHMEPYSDPEFPRSVIK